MMHKMKSAIYFEVYGENDISIEDFKILPEQKIKAVSHRIRLRLTTRLISG